jgi:pSer/pThr/pTyr-binding forkhead associated (FHA) protein
LEGASQLAREALGGKAIEISAFPFNIGRWEDRGEARLPFNNDLAIGDQRPYHVSRVHFCIARTGDAFSVVDRGSRLGTIVNGKRISGKAENKAAPLDREVNEILVGSRHSPYAFSVCIHPSGPTDG